MTRIRLGPDQRPQDEAGILTLVTEWEPMTQNALGDMPRIDRTTMITLVDDLERKGNVTRQRHLRDRRAFLIEPTGQGLAAKVDAIKILDEQKRRFLAPLTPDQQDQLLALRKLLQRPPSS